MEFTEKLKNKFENILLDWCVTFKLIGFDHETPRYAQVFKRWLTIDGIRTEKWCIQSTQTDSIFYIIETTAEEDELLENLQDIYACDPMDPEGLWVQFKVFRNNYIKNNHPTIKL